MYSLELRCKKTEKMKKHWSKRALVPSILSLLVLGTFILTGVISLEMQYQSVEYKGYGIYEAYNDVSSTERITVRGPIDEKDRWHGYVTIVHFDSEPHKASRLDNAIIKSTEEVRMVHGRREGRSINTYVYEDGTTETSDRCCYVNGVWKYNPAATKSTSAAVSSFQVLRDTYPWYLASLDAFNYDSAYVKSYLHKMDSILNTHSYGDTPFLDYYDDALSQLQDTPYDSIIVLQSTLTFLLGIEEMKNHEYRQAVVDRFWAGEGSSYGTVETTYVPYLEFLNEGGISDSDFEQFCHVVDSIMDSYEPLDPEDPFFVDSIDMYLYMAISEILDVEENSNNSNASVKKRSFTHDEFNKITKTLTDINPFNMYSVADDRTAEVADYVVLSMYFLLLEGDIIMKVTEKAWLKNQSVVTLPTVATDFTENTSATSVTLHGYIVDDGGANITANGIVWATYYNPSLDDNRSDATPGSDDFIVTIDGLTEGTTYYARTYATNSAGTAYGNSIEFTAESASGIDPKETNPMLSIYPNPTSGVTSFKMYSPSQETVQLILFDLKGSIVHEHTLDAIPGNNMVQLDLSFLEEGMYLCKVRSGSDIRASERLMILK